MNKFEIGKEYFSRSICNYDCIFTIKITGRTAKTVSYEYMGDSRRSKIRVDDSGEYIQPDRYSTVILLEPNQYSVQNGDGRFPDQAAYPLQGLDKSLRVYVRSHAAAFLLVFCFCSSGRTLTVWVEKVTFRTILLPVARML